MHRRRIKRTNPVLSGVHFTITFPLLFVIAFLIRGLDLSPRPVAAAGEEPGILDIMAEELERSMRNIAHASEEPMYYLQYSVTEERTCELAVRNGGFEAPEENHRRYLDVDMRVGSPELDSTHEIRGGSWRDNWSQRRVIDFPLEHDPDAIRSILWNETEYQYNKAQERFTKVKTNRQVKVEEEDLSNDFSSIPPQKFEEEFSLTDFDEDFWRKILKKTGTYFTKFPDVRESEVKLAIKDEDTFMVNSEGSRLEHSRRFIRLILSVHGMAADGMELSRYEIHDAATMDGLPDEEIVMADVARLVEELRALIDAPLVEPYIGPAILRNRASGVFFHEIFGHRIEGHRQKSEDEGQTFTKKVGQRILPEFISVYDDPTLRQFNGVDLRGYYKFDDEGTPTQRVTVVEKGVLKNFLTSRSPIRGFPLSNGHGRRHYGQNVVARQGNLIIHSDSTVSFAELRERLIEECRRQDKPYGLIFENIAGGFTMTGRRGPQAFKVMPLLVYRVYTDGKPDEVIRGVDIVGTPLTSFSKIMITGDDDGIFNGTCGAESGWVPVSGISPSILVSEIEVEKSRKEHERPPILPPPPRTGEMSIRGNPTENPLPFTGKERT